jgi:hypothetical protein
MAASKNIKVGPFAKPPPATEPAHAKVPGTSAAFPPASPKRPPVTGKGRI